MIVKFDEDNFSIKLYSDFVKGKLVGLMEVIPIDELLEVWQKHKADTPQTDLLVKTPHKSRESHEKNCETCRDKDTYDEWQGNCDECENGSMYTPQTDSEVTRNSLRTDCTGCKFVGWYDTDFPCVNCVRKNKDYYTAEQTDCSRK